MRHIDRTALTAKQFLKMYSEGLFTSGDIIVRTRAKVQEQRPDLRGYKWEQRHKAGQEVTQEIHKV